MGLRRSRMLAGNGTHSTMSGFHDRPKIIMIDPALLELCNDMVMRAVERWSDHCSDGRPIVLRDGVLRLDDDT